MTPRYDHIFKVIVIGDSSVGKSSLISRFVQDTFEFDHNTTLGVDMKYKIIQHQNKSIKIQLWDTAGQERYQSIVSNYYRNADGVIICFDLTAKDTYKHVLNWLDTVDKNIYRDHARILVGTKQDLTRKREVQFEDALLLANDHQMDYIEISSKLNRSARIENELFYKLCNKMLYLAEMNKQSIKLTDSNTSVINCCF